MGGSTILGNTQINKKIPSKKKKGGSKNQPANQPTNQDISRSEALVHPKHWRPQHFHPSIRKTAVTTNGGQAATQAPPLFAASKHSICITWAGNQPSTTPTPWKQVFLVGFPWSLFTRIHVGERNDEKMPKENEYEYDWYHGNSVQCIFTFFRHHKSGLVDTAVSYSNRGGFYDIVCELQMEWFWIGCHWKCSVGSIQLN